MKNDLEPPLPMDSSSLDFIYSISVLTHLSADVCRDWLAELRRVSSSGGILLMTTNGDSLMPRMLPAERKEYELNGVLDRAKVQEGKRCFLAIHSPEYAKTQLFNDFVVLSFLRASFPFTGQDVWILRKPN